MLIIFDWDGTLCDSVEQIVLAMQAAASRCALPPPEAAAVRHIVGLGLPQAVEILFPDQPLADRERLARAYSSCYIEADQGPARLFEGALDTLAQLRDAGFELAVATGKSRRGLVRVLQGLGLEGFFDATRCADETQSKPHPLMLEQILAERSKRANQALMIGDSEYDLAMARAIGMPSVGVSYGVHARELLLRHQPRAIVDELRQLGELAELLLRQPESTVQASTG
ncbi:HAD family hydrolase [Kineobactrum salinum]|uniref:HAD-IA family hydrolase n=1 Tax=Kineobactrum salinum TaxID=2708301 RepID=A0A6C0U5H2_9GAMM|nr:HAD-IA family hydrolase [Kineobactrum salinum]QIB67410.1 HAD-IA family hydrolase [Kineobactrum salinum]